MKSILKQFYIIVILLLLIIPNVFASIDDYPINLTSEEKQWLADNKNRSLLLGIDSYSGTEYFKFNNEEKGYILPLINHINNDLHLNIKLNVGKSWSEVYSGLINGKIDILIGANETQERDAFMAFTRPLTKYNYVIIAKKDNDIHTIGDIDNKTIGFLDDDIVTKLLPKTYKNIKYNVKFFSSQDEGFKAVKENKIDAFISSGGPVIYDYLYNYPDLVYAFKIGALTSDITFSTRKDDIILRNILDKEIEHLSKETIPKLINDSEIEYNIKIMNLTPKEVQWLKTDGQATIGITKDYLPFDYYIDGEYKGISAEILKEISRKTGIKLKYYYDDFDKLNNMLQKGTIDILNIAKTEDRLKYIIYPRPYSTERDIIVGRNDSRDVRDVFGLEGKRVAVIKGFWHYEYLKKNLINVNIIETTNIQQSLKLIHEGKADYLIENPTVVRFYTEELQLYDLVQKGETSTDSYLYYGIQKGKPELASIINKALPLMDIDQLIKKGYEDVPHNPIKSINKSLIFIIIVLISFSILILLLLIKILKALIFERTQSAILRERENLLYKDSLTGVQNRNFLNDKLRNVLNDKQFPQSIIATDMNNLKLINDKYGHDVGDEFLKLFSTILKEVTPKGSIIIRMGGDEFIIILEGVALIEAEKIIFCLKETMLHKFFTLQNGDQIFTSASFGCHFRINKDDSFDEALKIADKRMYKDKHKYKKNIKN